MNRGKNKKIASGTKNTNPITLENSLLIREAKKIVEALGKMFAPCCEVVLHDLSKPSKSIVAIECPLSGRKIGDSTTAMGRERINNINFPDVIQNYSNSLPDGRPTKSTSIGLRNSEGKCIASICLNLDISQFSAMQNILKEFTSTHKGPAPVKESLHTRSVDDLRDTIDTFSAKYNTQPRALNIMQRSELIQLVRDKGLLNLRGAATIIADILGISRGSVYHILNTKI